MNSGIILDAVAPVSQEGLSLSDIVRDLPSDPGSIFALVLGVGFLALVIYFGTRPGKPLESSGPERTDPPDVRTAPAAVDPGKENVRIP